MLSSSLVLIVFYAQFVAIFYWFYIFVYTTSIKHILFHYSILFIIKFIKRFEVVTFGIRVSKLAESSYQLEITHNPIRGCAYYSIDKKFSQTYKWQSFLFIVEISLSYQYVFDTFENWLFFHNSKMCIYQITISCSKSSNGELTNLLWNLYLGVLRCKYEFKPCFYRSSCMLWTKINRTTQ